MPFCVQWKGKIPAGTTYDHPIIQLDILPTAIAAAGGKVDPAWKLDGVDLMPYLTGKNKGAPHEMLYWRFGEQWAIRKGDWKLVASNVDGVKNAKLLQPEGRHRRGEGPGGEDAGEGEGAEGRLGQVERRADEAAVGAGQEEEEGQEGRFGVGN